MFSLKKGLFKRLGIPHEKKERGPNEEVCPALVSPSKLVSRVQGLGIGHWDAAITVMGTISESILRIPIHLFKAFV